MASTPFEVPFTVPRIASAANASAALETPGQSRVRETPVPPGLFAPDSQRQPKRTRRAYNFDFIMLGDAASPPFKVNSLIPSSLGIKDPPLLPNNRTASALVPSARGLKIAENQSPCPQDRVYYSFNYYDNLNASLNRHFDSPISNIQAYRSVFGFEKTFDDGQGSFGLRLPLDTLTTSPRYKGDRYNVNAGTSTDVGDLSFYTKYILKENFETGDLISAGFAMTVPTGPAAFAGSQSIRSGHTTTFQPFLGGIFHRNRFYALNFTSIDFPIGLDQPTIFYEDIGLGYVAYRAEDAKSLFSSIAPTFEVHANIPLTHRAPYNQLDPGGLQDIVDLTFGVNIGLRKNSLLTFGYATPATSPRPFDGEVILLLNVRFGGARSTLTPALPMVGG